MTALAATLTWLSALVPISAPNARYIEVAHAVVHNFPVEARQTMMCIGYWETRQDPYSNKLVGAAGEVSWAQIAPVHFRSWPRDWLRKSADNATQAAKQIYDEALKRTGNGFSPWTTYWAYCRR